jgi:hypothetical protein
MERPVIRTGIAPAEDPRLSTAHCYDYLCPHAALKMAWAGFEVSELIGGYDGWVNRGYKVETDKDCDCSEESCNIN